MKKIVFVSVMALMLGACATHSHKETCACGMEKSAKSDCKDGECKVEKKASGGCPDCHAAEEKKGN